MSGDAEAITRALRGFTELRGFELTFDPYASKYRLRLTLANKKEVTRVLVCDDVQNLELNATGDGFEQLLMLRVEDVRDDGLDRIAFVVDELEREGLFLHCVAVELVG